ncbi:Protein of unknown function [Pyronema omphalodes CBS 100304]|uniref:Uncharacterized protein n=1 Tax=Pyronema omphalodes (strain CBS 100304) TaxID=1076935 RepID=U4LNG3_PYROM|nr:Protein of unknown function [Pyronema omphalodes CBS 100304]
MAFTPSSDQGRFWLRGGLKVDVTCSWSNPRIQSELDGASKANKILLPGDGFIRADFCGWNGLVVLDSW